MKFCFLIVLFILIPTLCVAKKKEDNFCRGYNEEQCLNDEKCIYFKDSKGPTILKNLNEFYQQFQELESLLKNSGQEQCTVEKNKMDKEHLKQLSKEISQRNMIQRRVGILEKQLKNMKKKKKRWNSKPSGVIYTNKFPVDESGHSFGCINNSRKRKADPETCNQKCKSSSNCKFVWQYSNQDRCCFKTRHSKKRGFRRGRRIKGWYTKV